MIKGNGWGRRMLAMVAALVLVLSSVPSLAEDLLVPEADNAIIQPAESYVDIAPEADLVPVENEAASDAEAQAPPVENESVATDVQDENQEEEGASDSPVAETPDVMVAPEVRHDNLAAKIAANGYVYAATASAARVYRTPEMSEEDVLYAISQDGVVLLVTEKTNNALKVWLLDVNAEVVSGYIAASAMSDNVLDDDSVAEFALALESARVTTDAGEKTIFVAPGEALAKEEIHTEDPAETVAEMENVDETEEFDNDSDVSAENVTEDKAEENEDAVAEEQNTTKEPGAVEEPEVLIAPDLENNDVEETVADQKAGYAKVPAGTVIYISKNYSRDYCVALSDLYAFVSEFDDEWAAINAVRKVGPEEDDYDGEYTQFQYYVRAADFAFVEEDEAESVKAGLAGNGFFMNGDENYPLDILQYEEIERDRREYQAMLRSSSVSSGPDSGSNTGLTSGSDTTHGKVQQYAVYKQLKYGDTSSNFTPNISTHSVNGIKGLCINADLSSYNGDKGTLQEGMKYLSSNKKDRGMFAILANANLSNSFDYVIAQAAMWLYLRSDSSYDCTRCVGRRVDRFYSGNTSQYTHAEVRKKIQALIDAATAAEKSGIPTGKITEATAGELTLKNDVYTGSVTVKATEPIKIPKSSLSKGATITNATSEDSDFYRFGNEATIKVQSTSSKVSFDIESASMYDEMEFWVSVAKKARQDIAFEVDNIVGFGDSRSISMEAELFGDIQVKKTDDDSGVVLKGAKFNLVQNKTTVATATTNANGVATFSNVKAGTYTVQEEKAPTGYAISATASKNVTVVVNQTTEVTFTNKKITGKLQVKKVDKKTGEALGGAKFSLRDLDGNLIATKTANASTGIATFTNVEYGKYKIQEVGAPEGYQVSPELLSVNFTPETEGSVQQIEFEDEVIYGSLQVKKVDKDDPTKVLSGAKFKVYVYNETTEQYEEAKDIDGNTLGEGTTGNNGYAEWNNVAYGTYYIKETMAPKGYNLDTGYHKGVVEDQGQEVTIVHEDTVITGSIKIVKTDAVRNIPVVGAEFSVSQIILTTGTGEGPNERLVPYGTIVTGEDGTGILENIPFGRYRIQETNAPAEYVLSTDTVDVNIDQNGEIEIVELENQPRTGDIEVLKFNELDNRPLNGVQFEIVNEAGDVVETITTNTDGYAKSGPLVTGTYTVREKNVPEGYVVDLKSDTTTVQPGKTEKLTFYNRQIRGKIKILKVDKQTREPLAGVEFKIGPYVVYSGGEYDWAWTTITTDENGEAITDWLPYQVGGYTIYEINVPHDYDDRIGNENINNTTGETAWDHLVADGVQLTEDGQTLELTFENTAWPGKIRIAKVDHDTGNPIAGVVFDIYENDEYGRDLENPVASMTTNESGFAESPDLRKGTYHVVERTATTPHGYIHDAVEFDIEVKPENPHDRHQVTAKLVENTAAKVKLILYKRDTTRLEGYKLTTLQQLNQIKWDIPDQEPLNPVTPETIGDGELTGAEYKLVAHEDITDLQGNIVHHAGDVIAENLVTSGELAYATTDELWPGVYDFIETKAPKGYILDETPVTVTATADKVEVIMCSRSFAWENEEGVIYFDGMKANQPKTGVHAIVKIYSDNKVITDPGHIERPEEGAEFEVFLKRAGSYENAADDVRDYLITDDRGYAVTKQLPAGVYTFRQVKGKSGFAIKSPFDVTITGDEDPLNPPQDVVNNQAIPYRLRIIKVDKATGKTITLAHTTFKVKDAEGNFVKQIVHYPQEVEIDEFETDESGTVTLPETMMAGNYFVVEIKAPEGYVINTKQIAVRIGGDNDTMPEDGNAYLVDIKVPDEEVLGDIILEKTGLQLTGFEEMAEDGITYYQPIYEEKKLVGAVFDVFAAEDIVGKEGTLYHNKDDKVGSITTTDGVDKISDLHLGKYYLKEVSAPEGYVFEDTVYEAELVYEDQNTKKVEVTVTAGNTYLPIELTVNKEKEVLKVIELEDGLVHQIVAREPGEGFVFGLYNAEEIAYEGGALAADSAVAIGTTDSEGKLVFSGLYPHGKYYVQELKTVTGWKLNTNKFNVTLDPAMKAEDDNVIRVALAQPVLNDFIYTPYTITKTNLTESETVPGALIEVLDEDGNVIYREYTDENGEIKDIPVKPGNYTFREIIAPEGYVLNVAEMKFTVDEDGKVTGDSIIHDDYTRVVLKKVDDEGTPMAGVEFQLAKKDDGTILFTATTDENGLVKFEKIPYGTYVISETKPLSGYIKNSTDIVIVIDRNYMNKDVPNFEIPNYPNEVVIRKSDNKGEPLEGATFGLFDEDGNQVMTAVSDENGEVKFRKIPDGTYTIRETIAPDGFLINKTVKTVTIDDTYRNSAEPLATYINQPKKIKYIKVDTSGKALPGVEFSLIDASNNEIVETVTSNENGEFIFTKFDYGDWIIRETEAPEGFNKMDDITLHVDENWTEPEPFTCVNIPNHYEFVKTDNKGNPLPGVKFRLEDEEGNDLGEYISDENGIVRVTDLKPGTYIIREIETAKGFQRTDEVIKVEISEKYIVPEEMFHLINYPNVQTGVEFQMTPLMWAGAACVLAAAGLAVVYGLNRKTAKQAEKPQENDSAEDKNDAQEDSKEESENKE